MRGLFLLFFFFCQISEVDSQAQTYKSVNNKFTPNKISYFPLGTVKLLPGNIKVTKDKIHDGLLDWDIDRLLYWHRKAAGLNPKAEHYGGWENGGSNILGHYLTAVSLMYQTTGDRRLLERITYIVDELAECQRQSKDGYVFNGLGYLQAFQKATDGIVEFREIGPEFPLFNNGNYFYGIHKNIAGLRDAFFATGNGKARQVLQNYVDWIERFVKSISDSTLQNILDVEHGGMTEVIADMYAITGEYKYVQLAKKFVHQKVVQPVSRGMDMLHPHHANAKIPQFAGYAHLYSLIGNEAEIERRSAENFFDIVVGSHMMSNGGNSEYERFGPPGMISQRLGLSSSETCNTYNMLKLSGELYSQTGDSKYFDYYERAFFNHILASVNENGNFCYYVSMKPGWFKTFSTKHNSNWCCVGTGLENPGKYEEKIYAYDKTHLYVNLFIPSEINWNESKFSLKQIGDIRNGDTLTFTVTKAANKNGLKIRVPQWVKGKPQVWLNGKLYSPPVNDNYMEFSPALKKKDIIRIYFPMELRFEYTTDNQNAGALCYGPTLLVGCLGKEGIENLPLESEDYWGLQTYPEAKKIPVLIGSKTELSSWITKSKNRELEFNLQSASGEKIVFRPIASVNNQRYSAYWDVFTPGEWSAYQSSKSEQIKDIVNISDSVSEKQHQLSYQHSDTGTVNFKKFRSAKKDGWFSYKMNSNNDSPLFLLVQYWGGGWQQDPDGTIDIYINNKKIERKDLGAKNKQTLFYYDVYEMPAPLLGGNVLSEIKFLGSSEKITGGVYQLKVVTSKGLEIKNLISE